MLGIYAHIAYWLCELYLECGGHNCSMINVRCVYSVPCCFVDGSDLICATHMYIHPQYVHVEYWTCIRP